MITAIRELRLARQLTLADVAAACVPPTTAQTIGRLETGTRTVSVAWLNRIGAAMGVTAADLVRLPDRGTLPVAALLGAEGARAPRRPLALAPPEVPAAAIAVVVSAGVGDYRTGDELWCEALCPQAFTAALHRDVLAPAPGGRFVFGRVVALASGAVDILPPGHGTRPHTIADPPWLARVIRLVRHL